MVNYENPWVCDDMCKNVHTCAISYVDYSDYAFCVDQAATHAGLDQRHVNEAVTSNLQTSTLFLMTTSLVAILR